MFDLEKAIAEWRQQMLSAGIQPPTTLDELESHLRQEIEQQMKSGLSEREAFNSAVQKIGQARALKTEFMRTTVKGRRISQRFVRRSLVTFSIASLVMASFWLRQPTPDPATLASLFKSDKVSLLNLYNTFASGADRSDFVFECLVVSLILTVVFAALNLYSRKRSSQPGYV
jgi:hypothetical protein